MAEVYPREELLSQLYHLRTALVDHFWNEENEGFFDEVTALAPRLVPQAHKLCAEHQEMMRRRQNWCDSRRPVPARKCGGGS